MHRRRPGPTSRPGSFSPPDARPRGRRVRATKPAAGPKPTASTRRKDSWDDTQDSGRRGPHPRRRSCLGCRLGSGDLPGAEGEGHRTLALERQGRRQADNPGQLLRFTAGPLDRHLRRASAAHVHRRLHAHSLLQDGEGGLVEPLLDHRPRAEHVSRQGRSPGTYHPVYVTVGGKMSNSLDFYIDPVTTITTGTSAAVASRHRPDRLGVGNPQQHDMEPRHGDLYEFHHLGQLARRQRRQRALRRRHLHRHQRHPERGELGRRLAR